MSTTHDAFISYSHQADLDLATGVERGLQRLARPWNRVRALSVFRDASDLSLSPHIWPSIQEHLDGSRFLIVLACPESAASVWVNREITHFCDTKGSDSVVLVLTGGELEWDDSAKHFTAMSTALPPALNERLDDEPLWLDMRWARGSDELTLRVGQFRTAIAQLASPIRGMSPEDLSSEDVRQHRRAVRLARLAVATVAVLAIIASIAAVVAVGNAHRAERRAREATGGQLGLDALDLPSSEMARALLLSVAASELAPQSDESSFRASRVLIGRYSKLTAVLDAGAQREGLSVQALALAADGRSVVGLATREGVRELLRWDTKQRGEPAALAVPSGVAPRLAPIGDAGAVVVGDVGGTIAVSADGELHALDGTAVAIDAAHDRAVMLTGGGAETLVDLLTGAVVAELDGGAIALDHGRLVVGSDSEVHVVDASTGNDIASTALEPGSTLQSASLSPDGAALVAVASSGRLQQWRVSGSTLVVQQSVAAPAGVGAVTDVAVAADGIHALVVGLTGSAVVDLADGNVVGAGPDETGIVEVDPAGRYAAVGGKQLVVWDLRSGDRVFAVPETANALAWNGPCADDGLCRLVTAGETLDVWNPTAGRRIRLADQTNAEAVAVSADASVVASAGFGSTVALWSTVPVYDDSSRETLASAGAATSVDPVSSRVARATSATTVEITGDGGSTTVTTGAFVRMVLAPSARRLVTSTSDGRVHLFDVANGQPIDVDDSCAGDLMAVSSAGDMVAVFDTDQLIAAVCDTATGGLAANAKLAATTEPPAMIAVDDDGSVALGDRLGLVTVLTRAAGGKGFDGRAPAVDTRAGKEPAEVRSLSIHHGVVAAGIRTPAARGARGSVLVWPLGGTAVQFDSESTDVPAVALLGDSRSVLVASRDADNGPVTLQAWETATRRRLGQAFSGLSGDIAVLGGDGSSIVGVDSAGSAYRWHPAATATDEICAIVGRPLTRDEWDNELDGALAKFTFQPVCTPS